MADAIVVFARLPVPGKVKSRLAAGVGPDAAAALYAACAERAIAEASRRARARGAVDALFTAQPLRGRPL